MLRFCVQEVCVQFCNGFLGTRNIKNVGLSFIFNGFILSIECVGWVVFQFNGIYVESSVIKNRNMIFAKCFRKVDMAQRDSSYLSRDLCISYSLIFTYFEYTSHIIIA